MALCQPGDTMLGMSLAHGGHLTHGAKPNFSGKLYNAVQYGLDPSTGEIDYEEVRGLAREHKPRMIVAGFSAYSRVIDWGVSAPSRTRWGLPVRGHGPRRGLIAAGVYPSPVQIADVTTTTTHKTLRGPRGGLILAKSNPEIEKKLNSLVFPGTQGGPLMHVIAAKAVAFKEAMEPGFKDYQAQVLLNAQTHGGGLHLARVRRGLGRHQRPPVPGELHRAGAHRQGCRRLARDRQHHGKHERGTERSPVSLRHQRDTGRDAGHHDPRVRDR